MNTTSIRTGAVRPAVDPSPGPAADQSPALAQPAGRPSIESGGTAEPTLAPPPPPTEASRRAHAIFLKLNRWSTVPLLRAGMGPWLGTPIGGYLLLLRVRGRRTGILREVPLSYLVAEGAVWVCAGLGPGVHWYRNLLADPAVEVVLPGRTVACVAEDVRDPEVRRRMMPALVRALGLPGALGGVDPRQATDGEILQAYGWVPLVRLRSFEGPIVAGPDDPGGSAWIWRQMVILGLIVAIGGSTIGTIRGLLARR